MALGDVIARLSVSLGLETAAFEKGATLAEKRANQMQRKFAKLGDQIGSIGQKMTLGLTAPLGAFGVSAFNAASDAAELQSAFNETFGDMSDDMTAWAEATGNAMGRSTQELQRAANTFGIFFNQAAPTREEAAKMSQTFTVLAQDLASFYNVSESDALQKLRSGLAGEAEPLRDFGVFLSAAAVEAKGLEMGLGGLSGELTEQEKIMARYALILESTTNAQGDVARTSDGTANQMRKAKAAFEELQVVVGTKLLPAITPLIAKLASLIDWFAQLPSPVQDGIVVVGGIAAALGPLLMVVGQLTTAIPLLAKALTFLFAHPIILGAAALIAGIYLAWKNWDKISEIVSGVYNAVKTWIMDKLSAVWDFVKRAATAYFELYTYLPRKAIEAVASLYRGVKSWLQDKLGAVFDWVREKIRTVERAFHWLGDQVVFNSHVPDMVTGIAHEFGKLSAVMVAPTLDAVGKVNAAFAGMAGGATGAFAAMTPGRGVPGALEAISEGANDNAERTETATVRIAKSFKDMAEETMGALRRMTDAIKGGGFLDILEGVLGLGLQLGSIGVFGKTIQANINASIGGFATGTASAPPGLAWVGERGPELVQFRGGERVYSNAESRAMARGGGTLDIRPSPLFEAYLDGKLVQAAPALVDAGGRAGVARMAYRGSRSIR